MSDWETRMSARVRERRRETRRRELARLHDWSPATVQRFLNEHPDLDEGTRVDILTAGEACIDPGFWLLPPEPYDPWAYRWSADEVWADSPEECRECFEARPYPPGQRHLGWCLWLVCGDGCGHSHHDDEVWLAASDNEPVIAPG